ncbi:uncharacterized protein LOC110451060 [Mizuhopecten yessoensis]|uniref:uncharacterized protein LOC110451060 n=1 Tax=Mizuhopecten yessoensis TaxID=6573 RepID=UPI000B45D73A|nr:uncharacterized protein LOC110451060 [Mizuhopecten yessoensis]
MNAKMVIFVGLMCLFLATDVTAYFCHWCNEDLRICKRSCRGIRGSRGRGRNHQHSSTSRCHLPCYQEAVYCLNTCDQDIPFAMSQLDADDKKTASSLQMKAKDRSG